MSNTLSFSRLRFSFQAEARIQFAKMAANSLRGALGYALRETAGDQFQAMFSPAAEGRHPSGLADSPRPFVFRSAHLDEAIVEPGQSFHFDVHMFDTRPSVSETLIRAFELMGRRGIGPGSSRMLLRTVEPQPLVLSLEPSPAPVDAISVDFLTPTELKSSAQLAPEPLFPILFARVRDRIATLQALYGDGPMDIDFRAMGDRAAAIRMTASEIRHVETTRRSSRTGQRHPIGGFVGSADYEGPLAEFLPWLQAAVFTGVGRQTTWGKGEIRVRVR